MATAYLRALRLFSRDVRLYLISLALAGFAYFGIYTLLLNLYLLRLGYGPEFVGLVNATGLLAWAIFSLPAGALGRRLGIRRMMIVGVSVMVVGYGLLPLAEFTPTTLRAGWLLTTYILAWFGAALYLVNSNPFLMGVTSPEERNHAFSVREALLPLTGFAGNLVGGILPGLFANVLGGSLDHPMPYRYPLLIAAALYVPAALVLLATREVNVIETREMVAEAGSLPFGPIALVAAVMLVGSAGDGVARAFFNVYLDAGLHVTTAQIGVLSAVGQLLAVPTALAMPLIASRWGTGRTIVFGSLGMVISLLLMAFIPHWGAVGLGFMGVIALVSIRNPAFTVYSMEMVPQRWQSTMSGAVIMTTGLSWSAMALGGGYIITALGYRSLFLTGAGLTAAGALLFWAYFFLRTPRGEFARRAALNKAK